MSTAHEGAGEVRPGGDLAWLRHASGDDRLRPWCLTSTRLAAYVAGVRAMARGGPEVEATDPSAVLDLDRQAALRPWELRGVPPSPFDPVRVIVDELEARPPLAAVIASQVSLPEFAAAHVKLVVCARALALLLGEDAFAVDPARLQEWVALQRPRFGAEADFGASLVTMAANRAVVDAAFEG